MADRFERGLNLVLVAAALVVAVGVGYRSFIAPPTASRARPAPDFIKEWRDAVSIGHRVGGDSSAPVTIVEFSDLECPVCRGYQATVRELLADYPTKVQVVYVSYPLPQHRNALPAARAAECAYATGAFRSWIEAVYDRQDSLGTKSWGSYAQDARITDTAAIRNCALATATVPSIQAGRDFGDRIQVDGTPTILVNGWRYKYTPSSVELRSAVDRVLDGRHP